MKASIITMTRTYNYGATLQAYALSKFVEKLGCECDIIDHMRVAESPRKISLLDFSKVNLLRLPYKGKLERGYRRFERFYEEHMNMGKRYENAEELKSSPPDSDVFISGSDQVWNPSDSKIDRFLLDFAPSNKKRISYAASMGNPVLPEDKREKYVEGLKRFDAISVREREARDMIAPLTDKAVNINCDPAFLLNADEWRSLESPVDGLIENEYVLCYLIHIPIWFNDWAKNLKKTCGKKIVFVGLNGRLPVFCDKYIRDAGPREFLWLIDHAYAVVSSSFHGNVFSLIFGKGLISTPDQKRPDRIRNLLRLFKQEHREMRGASDQYHLEAIDADGVKNIATALQKEAKEYLLNAFEGYEK